jgi:hypothetical protein
VAIQGKYPTFHILIKQAASKTPHRLFSTAACDRQPVPIIHLTLSPSIRHALYRVFQEETSLFCEVIVSVILSKKVFMYVYTCPIPNGYRDRAISVYSCKIVDQEILRTVSNIGMQCSSDTVRTVYPVQYILISVCNVQVAQFVLFTQCNAF